MKRIYYPTVTIDVSDRLADLLVEVHTELTDLPLTHPVTQDQQTRSVPFAAGRNAIVDVPGYLDGSNDPTVVKLLIGGGIALAVAPLSDARPDAPGTDASVDDLEHFFDEDEDDS